MDHQHEWERTIRDGLVIEVRCKCGKRPLEWLGEQVIKVHPSPSAASSQEKTESGSTAHRRRRKAAGPSR